MPSRRTRSSSSSSAASTDGERRAVGRRRRDGVEKRLLGRQQRAGHRRCEAALDERAIQPRAALRRRHAKAGPQVDALGAGQHRVEHQQREETADRSTRRRVIADLQIGGRAFLANRRRGARRSVPARWCGPRSGVAPAECRRNDARPGAAPRRCRRRRRSPAWRCSGCSSGGSSRTDRRASSSAGRTSQPIVGCRYGCALNAVAVSS